jgi:hypothetical protein
MNTHSINDVRPIEMHTAEPLGPELSSFEVQIATEGLKRYKSPGIHQIPGEIMKQEVIH